jgi:hypothetical protein
VIYIKGSKWDGSTNKTNMQQLSHPLTWVAMCTPCLLWFWNLKVVFFFVCIYIFPWKQMKCSLFVVILWMLNMIFIWNLIDIKMFIDVFWELSWNILYMMLILSCIIIFLLSLLLMMLIKSKISNKYMVPKFNVNIKFKLSLGKLNMQTLKYYIIIRWEK